MCERLLAHLDGRPLDDLTPESFEVLTQVPHAYRWAREFSSGEDVPLRRFRDVAAPGIVRVAVSAVANACIIDRDIGLRDVLENVIAETRRLAPPRHEEFALERSGRGPVGHSSLDWLQMLMPASVACRSISASSSVDRGGLASAATFCSSCATLLAPMSADVTRWSRSTHTSASWARDWPRAAAIVVERPDPGEALVGDRVGLQRVVLGGPRVGGDPVEVAVGEQALGERREGDAPGADLLERVEQLVVLDPAVEHRVRRLVDQQRHPRLAQQRERPRGCAPTSTTRCRRRAPCPAARR